MATPKDVFLFGRGGCFSPNLLFDILVFILLWVKFSGGRENLSCILSMVGGPAQRVQVVLNECNEWGNNIQNSKMIMLIV